MDPRAPDPVDYNEYSARLSGLFDRLLVQAESEDLLFYLVNLFNCWHQIEPVADRADARTADFVNLTNEWTKALVHEKTRKGERYVAHEMLFIFQLNMEGKGFYAAVRNFVYSCLGKLASPEPWRDDEWSGTRGVSTGKLVKNLGAELREAGFAELAEEFSNIHEGGGSTIRNAIAHGTFLLPTADTGQEWVFANYHLVKNERPVLKTKRYSHDELVRVYQRFFALRRAFFRTVAAHCEKYHDEYICLDAPEHFKNKGIMGFSFVQGKMCLLQLGGAASPW